MRVAVVVPTYNEVDNLPLLASALFSLPVPDLHLVVVDDNSPDGTGAVAEALKATYPGRVHVIHRPRRLGLGSAYITGFRQALNLAADAVLQMDADFSHDPADVPRLLAGLHTHDLVIGSRYVAGGRLDVHWSWWRRFLSWWANAVYVRLILDTSVHDATAGFMAWRRAALEAIDLDSIRSNGYIFLVELKYVAEKLGLRILEVPIYFRDRTEGRSKMDARVKLEAAWRVWQIRWRYRHLKPVSSLVAPSAEETAPPAE